MKKFLIITLTIPILSFAQTAKKSITTEKMPGVECDNTIINKLDPSGIMRSPSECELLFDQKVRKIFDEAFSRVFFRKNGDWVGNRVPDLEPIKNIGKGTEVHFYRLMDTDKGDFSFDMQASPGSVGGITWSKKYDSLMHAGQVEYEIIRQFLYDARAATHIVIFSGINNMGQYLTFFKGGQEILKIPNTFFAIRGSNVAAGSGGGLDNALEACLILIGKWKQPQIKKEAGGASSFYADGTPSNALPHLRVQNIYLRIECSREIQDRLFKEIDFKKLNELLQD